MAQRESLALLIVFLMFHNAFYIEINEVRNTCSFEIIL